MLRMRQRKYLALRLGCVHIRLQSVDTLALRSADFLKPFGLKNGPQVVQCTVRNRNPQQISGASGSDVTDAPDFCGHARKQFSAWSLRVMYNGIPGFLPRPAAPCPLAIGSPAHLLSLWLSTAQHLATRSSSTEANVGRGCQSEVGLELAEQDLDVAHELHMPIRVGGQG